MSRKAPAHAPQKIRCAIYTRKSTEEGLEQEFNSLDAQREGAEAFIASQKAQGWVCLPERYDDGGFSGGTIQRPALARLLLDIEAGRIDCVVVYKVDRLSRSLLDFARIMETFEKQNVSFVSVTQQFNTTHSMGRLTLNVLLSFAQFEREIIGERIRDKISAQRRKGKWTGGVPVLGYDVDRSGPSPKLVINAQEAARARAIFALYLEHGSLLPVVNELQKRGWTTKARVTSTGRVVGGQAFDKCSLYALLRNPLYVGKIRHKKDLFDGEHEGIVDCAVFARVQTILQRNGRTGGLQARNRHGALLKGLLHCKACSRAMVHTFTTKRQRQYRYYTCSAAIKKGWAVCPSKSLPASEIERVVVEQIKGIGKDPALLRDVLREAQATVQGELEGIRREQRELEQELRRHHGRVRRLATVAAGNGTARELADLHECISKAEARRVALVAKTTELERENVTAADVRAAFADFENVWGQLSPREQARLLALLVASVEYDAVAGTVTVSFHACGIRTLAEQQPLEEAA